MSEDSRLQEPRLLAAGCPRGKMRNGDTRGDRSSRGLTVTLYRRVRRPFAPGEEVTPLNWRRGLFRLWLLGSAAWRMSWAIYFILSPMAHALTAVGGFLAIAAGCFGP